MQRRESLKMIGGISAASLLGLGASGSGAATNRGSAGRPQNPGRVGKYDGSKTFVPPDFAGFDQVIVYLAEPRIEGAWNPTAEAERFQTEIVGRSREEAEANRRAAEEFYYEKFGLEFTGDADLYEPEQSEDGTAKLNPFYQDPDVGYNAYMVSGHGMPNFHDDGATNRDEMLAGKVRDGGWIVSITEDTTLHGSYGGSDGFDIGEGGTLAFGDYNIKMGDQQDPIEIQYFSEHPILPLEVPVAFNCGLEHEDWGEGVVRGTTNIPGGGIRNVLTFPPSLDG